MQRLRVITNDQPVAAMGHNKPPGRFKRVCQECGQPFRGERRHAEFCCDAHRKAFNNRRMVRGAELYDLFMSLRYDRDTARLLKVWKVLCRFAAIYRDEDVRQREGRKSWQPARQVIERRAYVLADVLPSATWKVVGR